MDIRISSGVLVCIALISFSSFTMRQSILAILRSIILTCFSSSFFYPCRFLYFPSKSISAVIFCLSSSSFFCCWYCFCSSSLHCRFCLAISLYSAISVPLAMVARTFEMVGVMEVVVGWFLDWFPFSSFYIGILRLLTLIQSTKCISLVGIRKWCLSRFWHHQIGVRFEQIVCQIL